MTCPDCGHAAACHVDSGCLLCQAMRGDAFWCTRTDNDFRENTDVNVQ